MCNSSLGEISFRRMRARPLVIQRRSWQSAGRDEGRGRRETEEEEEEEAGG
jgi:hypothetical protein